MVSRRMVQPSMLDLDECTRCFEVVKRRMKIIGQEHDVLEDRARKVFWLPEMAGTLVSNLLPQTGSHDTQSRRNPIFQMQAGNWRQIFTICTSLLSPDNLIRRATTSCITTPCKKLEFLGTQKIGEINLRLSVWPIIRSGDENRHSLPSNL